MEENVIHIAPHLVPKPWGGHHLNIFVEKQFKKFEENIGEIVLISSIDQFPTYISSGKYKGQLFKDYWNHVGLSRYNHITSQKKIFPFLIKILSTSEPLSLQTHPSTQDLKEKFGIDAIGKFESWIILQADKNAKIYFGLKNEYSIQELQNINLLEQPLNIFNQYSPKQGDTYQLEPGIIHGTEGELLIYEIQEPSDYTFRIYDFGRNRELHINEALKVIRKCEPKISTWDTSLNMDIFQTNVIPIAKKVKHTVTSIFEVLTYFGPEARLYGDFGSFNLFWGDTFLLWKDVECFVEINDLSNTGSIASLPLLENEGKLFISSSCEQ